MARYWGKDWQFVLNYSLNFFFVEYDGFGFGGWKALLARWEALGYRILIATYKIPGARKGVNAYIVKGYIVKGRGESSVLGRNSPGFEDRASHVNV